MSTIRIKLLRPVVIKGFPDAQIGGVYDVPAGDAIVVMGLGAAVEVKDEPEPKAEPQGDKIEQRDPVIVNRDPEPAAADPGTQPKKSVRRKPAS